MPKLVQTVNRHTSSARDRVDPVADGIAHQARPVASDEQGLLTDQTESFKLVIATRQVGFETSQHHLGQRHATFSSGLTAIDAQCAFGKVEAVEVEALQLATAQAGAVQHRKDRDP
jgi:hypothetical protein